MSAATGADTVSVGGGAGDVGLGGGFNTFTSTGAWSGDYTGGDGVDTIVVGAGSTSSGAAWELGGANDIIERAAPGQAGTPRSPPRSRSGPGMTG